MTEANDWYCGISYEQAESELIYHQYLVLTKSRHRPHKRIVYYGTTEVGSYHEVQMLKQIGTQSQRNQLGSVAVNALLVKAGY